MTRTVAARTATAQAGARTVGAGDTGTGDPDPTDPEQPGTDAGAVIVSPTPDSALTSSTVTFQWSAGENVTYTVTYIGRSPGGNDVYSGAPIYGQTSLTVDGLPTDGSPLYVRLWSYIDGTYTYNDYAYTSFLAPPPEVSAAVMTDPAEGSVLTGPSAAFSWTAGTGVYQYELYVGAQPGDNAYYSGVPTSATSFTVDGLPTDGSMVYVRLWSRSNDAWYFNDYAYTAMSPVVTPATMVTPAAGSTLTGSSATFTWTTGSEVGEYELYVGDVPGGNRFYSGTPTVATSLTVDGLPTDGSKVYVRLWSRVHDSWAYTDYSYTATSPAVTLASMVSPSAGSTLTGTSVTFHWTTGTEVSNYELYVGDQPGGNSIYSGNPVTTTSLEIDNLPTDGSTVYVRLFSRAKDAWQYTDTTYTAASSLAVAQAVPVTAYHAYGDSITHGEALKSVMSAYPYLLATATSLPVKDVGISGIETCAIFYDEVAALDSAPTIKTNILRTLLSGTNDLYVEGTGAHEAVFNTCHQALIAWLAVPVEFRTQPGDAAFVAGGSCDATGACAQGTAGTITVNGLATKGAPLYLWYGLDDSADAAASFRLVVDGDVQGTYLTKPSATVPISKQRTIRSVALARVPLPAGTHTVSVQTDTGGISILGFGALPAAAYAGQPTVLVGDFPNQALGKEVSQVTGQQVYSADIRANVATLASDGLDVRLVADRRFLSNDPAEFEPDGVHPNEDGQQHLFQAFSDSLGTPGSPAPSLLVPAAGDSTPLPVTDLSFVAPTATTTFTLPAASSAARAMTVYNSSPEGAPVHIVTSGTDVLMPYDASTTTGTLDLAAGHSVTFYPDTTNGQFVVYAH